MGLKEQAACLPHEWEVLPAGSVGTENTYIWKCKRCEYEIEVDV